MILSSLRIAVPLLLLPLALPAVSEVAATRSSPLRQADGVPFAFEPNLGQFHEDVRFLVRAGNYGLFLTDSEWVAVGDGAGFRMQLEGATGREPWSGEQKLPGRSNYFLGSDPHKWRTGVPNFGRIRRPSVYAGIDAIIDGAGRNLEYSFHVHPGADPALIRLSYSSHAEITPAGGLALRMKKGEFRHSAPHAYQTIRGKHVPVAVAFHQGEGFIDFKLSKYDPRFELIIDPVVTFYGYQGGNGLETATASISDATGALYTTGWTNSLEYPTAGTPFRDFLSGQRDAFASKLHPSGTYFFFSTYMGGSQNDEGNAVSLDQFGNSFYAGSTSSPDFPTSGPALQRVYGGSGDALILKLNPEGSQLTYSSYAGGSGTDVAKGVASDSVGFATFTGTTASSNFPTVRATQGFGGADDIFILKLHANSIEIVFSTYVGSDASDQAYGVAIDKNGDSYVTGRSNCGHFGQGVTLGAVDGNDALVLKWRSDGGGPIYVTCAGGNALDSAAAIAVDRDGNAYITGTTSSTNFPTAFALQFAYGGAVGGSVGDAFVLKLNASGTNLLYSTYLGGARDDWGQSIVVDSSGSAYVAGATFSSNFPTASGVAVPANTNRSGFVVRVSPQGVALQEAFFFESIGSDDQFAVSLDERGSLYVVGGALAAFRIPSAKSGPFRNFVGPIQDAVIAKLATARVQILQETFPATVSAGSEYTFTQRLVNRGPDDADGVTYRGSVPGGATLISCTAPGANCIVTGNSYRVDLAQLAAGRGVELNLRLRINTGIPDGSALPIGAIVQSFTHDPNLTDNSLVTNIFTAPVNTSCSYALNSQAFTVPGAAGTLSINVTAPFNCPWAATTGTDWITIASPAFTVGTGSVTISFPANPLSVPRIGSLTVAGQRVIVLQRSAVSSAPFLDVPATYPFADTIQLLKYYGITSGCTATNYCPDATTTRGQMAVFIIRSLLGGDDFTFPAAPFFSDVLGNHPQYRYIQKMRELGITNGCGGNNYCPDDPVTRSQMAAFLIRARLAVAAGTSFPFPNTFSFADVPPNYPTYDAIQKMKELGITSGCSVNAYCPDEPTTRGQMSVFLTRAFLAP